VDHGGGPSRKMMAIVFGHDAYGKPISTVDIDEPEVISIPNEAPPQTDEACLIERLRSIGEVCLRSLKD